MSTALVIYDMALQLSVPRIEWCRYYLPRLDQYPNSRSHEDHPAGLLVVVDQVEENYNLHYYVCNNLDQSRPV